MQIYCLMDEKQVIIDFERWIMDVLDVPHAALNGQAPCPFAKQAWLKKRYRLVITGNLARDLAGTAAAWPADCDVWIWVCEQLLDVKELSAVTADANHTQLMPQGYIALEGHPQIPEAVLDCDMNQGQYCYVIVQPLDKLARSKIVLDKNGYYDNWPRDMYDQIVAARETC